MPPDRPFEWVLRDAAGPRTERWSRRDFWARHFPATLTERIVSLSGRSDRVVREWSRNGLPAVGLAFVDGGHDYRTARHDLLAAAHLGDDALGILVDDVVDRPGFGVHRAVRELFAGRVPVTMLETDWGHFRSSGESGMAWIDLRGFPAERERLRSLYERLPSRWHVPVLGGGVP